MNLVLEKAKIKKQNSLIMMNLLYKMANLLDGDFDGKQIRFDKRLQMFTIFIEFWTYFFAMMHVFVFVFPQFKYDAVYYKIHNGFGAYSLTV